MDVRTYQLAVNNSKIGDSSSIGNNTIESITKNLYLNDIEINIKYDLALNIPSNYVGDYFIDARCDSLVKEGE